ncbi:MAG: hypothetical protein KJ971_03510 [Firmicutes bacterium]|nr:hypothetical protein [Bacillota bacterium]
MIAKYLRNVTMQDLGPNPPLSMILESVQKQLQISTDFYSQDLGFGYEQMNIIGLFWVISRIRVEWKSLPVSNQTIQIETWPNPITKLGIIWNYRIMDLNGIELLKAMALWSIVSRSTLKLQNALQSNVVDKNLVFESDTVFFQINFKKISPIELQMNQTAICKRILSKDIDENLHVNNSCYIRYVVESLEHKTSPNTYQIHYIQPLYVNEEIELILKPKDEWIQLDGFVLRQGLKVLSFQAKIEG